MASFTLLVDSISIKNDDYAYFDEDELERGMDEQEYGFDDLKEQMDSHEEDASCTNGSVHISICEPYTSSKINQVLQQLGSTIDPAVRIVNATENFLAKLKSNNGTLTPSTQKTKRSSNNIGMCKESQVIESFELIHPHASLMYVISGASCVGNFCFSSFCSLNNPIGECVLTKRTMALHVFNNDGVLYTKSIEVGAACKCKSL